MLPPFDGHKLFKSLSWYYEYLRALARFLADLATNQITTQPRLLTHICYDIILYSIDSPFLAASGCFPRADWPVLHVCSCCCHVFSCIFYADCIMPHANSVRERERGGKRREEAVANVDRSVVRPFKLSDHSIDLCEGFDCFPFFEHVFFAASGLSSVKWEAGGGRRGRKQLGTWLNVT